MDPTNPRVPGCWKCGYDLTGLSVSDRCPECGTPVWSLPPGPAYSKDAQSALTWGIVSIVCFFACIGPLAGLLAIPAIVKGTRARREFLAGRLPAEAVVNAKTALILGWITAGLSIAVCSFYVLLLVAGIVRGIF